MTTPAQHDMPMLTVFGSINVDLIFALPHLPAAGETVLTSTYSQAVGGKGANQAAAAARDGAATRFIGCVGDDGLGATARAALAELGVDVGGLETVPGTTGVAAIWIDGEGKNQIAVASGANAALKADALVRRALARGAYVVLQMETPAAEVAAAIAHARRAGARVILNLAPALPLPRLALEQADILVVNEHEAAVLCDRLELALRDPADQASGLARHLGNTVIVTLGAAGAIGARRDEVLRVAALAVNAVDTTGAGDCFVGVLASALARGASLHAAMQRAAIAGSLACTVVGAMPSFPGRAQIDAALLDTGQLP
jgi:ribokinase